MLHVMQNSLEHWETVANGDSCLGLVCLHLHSQKLSSILSCHLAKGDLYEWWNTEETTITCQICMEVAVIGWKCKVAQRIHGGIILKSYITITPALHLTLEFPVRTRDMEVMRLQRWFVRRFQPQCSVISHEAGKWGEVDVSVQTVITMARQMTRGNREGGGREEENKKGENKK